jgi:16S rRNA (cytidine1402-2'-O)-methyltransferase
LTLYVVPTPIGNLEDITLRALRTLRDVSLVLAEDTRHTRRLLAHFEIDTPLLSYHQHNKITRLERALQALGTGDVALVSDSGTPSISDPGFELIEAVIEAGVPIDVLPGPSAITTAVVAAAIPAPGFLFVGFLPRRAGARRERLRRLSMLEYAIVLYEAPHRLLATLEDILSELGDRRMAAARELSKLHQEVLRGTVSDVARQFGRVEPRGEFTLVIAGRTDEPPEGEVDIRALLAARRAAGQDRKTAVAAVVADTGISRNEAYRLWLSLVKQAE